MPIVSPYMANAFARRVDQVRAFAGDVTTITPEHFMTRRAAYDAYVAWTLGDGCPARTCTRAQL